MKEFMSCSLVLSGEIMTTVRLTTGGICSLLGIDVEKSEDCKLCVTESLLLFKRSGFSKAKVIFADDEGLTVTVRGEERSLPCASSQEDGISYALLAALVTDLQMEKEEDRITGVRFRLGENND